MSDRPDPTPIEQLVIRALRFATATDSTERFTDEELDRMLDHAEVLDGVERSDDGVLRGPLVATVAAFFSREEAKLERRKHNDNGDGGVCTYCNRLHGPVTIVHACKVCYAPCDRPEDRLCSDHAGVVA